MRNFLLYGHGGSYNRGGEAIIKTTVELLRTQYPDNLIALSTHFRNQDKEVGLPVDTFLERNFDAIEKEKQSGNQRRYNCEIYESTLAAIDENTICLSVGGDNYCYPNWYRWKAIHERALQVGAKSVLWSCSIEPKMLDNNMLNTLKSHHLITARESLTYEALIGEGLDNVRLVSDVAFLLEPKAVIFPANFNKGNTVAINVSPLSARQETAKGILTRNILELIQYILLYTDMSIVLLPHVTMPIDNDFTFLLEIYNKIEEKSRVLMVGENLNAQELKYLISQCRFGVFARTHASIAAYSSCIPTIAIGYSIKAQGIAKDLGMEKYVIPIHQIKNNKDLIQAFKILCDDEPEIKEKLESCNQFLQEKAKYNLVELNNLIF